MNDRKQWQGAGHKPVSMREAIVALARALGVGVDSAEQYIRNGTSQWQTYSMEHDICVVSEEEQTRRIAASYANDIDGTLLSLWSSIELTQRKIDEALQTDELSKIKSLSGALLDLQRAYSSTAELKRTMDANSGDVVSKEQVESIISDAFPTLKQGLNDLFTAVKMKLPTEQRAEFEIIYKECLPQYSRHLSGVVKKLNQLLGNNA